MNSNTIDLVELLEVAVLRVRLANKEGNSILSAWLPEAEAAIAKARKKTPAFRYYDNREDADGLATDQLRRFFAAAR